jgi:hypothetical protein
MINIVIKLFIKGFSMSLIKTFAKDFAVGLAGDFIRSRIPPNLRTGQQQQQYLLGNSEDWRVRLTLAEGTNFLYQGILAPLSDTNGVIFPYTPNINIIYAANYDAAEPTHSNFKIQQYKNSSVDSINITCDFTAQDTFEAEYMLAVIHFFRTVTKMFYGQDTTLKPGTPPPLCFLHGLGAFQFDNHPLAITNFTYNLPTDVDYIRANITTYGEAIASDGAAGEQGQRNLLQKAGSFLRDVATYRLGSSILKGGVNPPPIFAPPPLGKGDDVTYVPTKIQIQLTAVPIVTRNTISNEFSLEKYASGQLLRGTRNNGGGIW